MVFIFLVFKRDITSLLLLLCWCYLPSMLPPPLCLFIDLPYFRVLSVQLYCVTHTDWGKSYRKGTQFSNNSTIIARSIIFHYQIDLHCQAPLATTCWFTCYRACNKNRFQYRYISFSCNPIDLSVANTCRLLLSSHETHKPHNLIWLWIKVVGLVFWSCPLHRSTHIWILLNILLPPKEW